MYYTIKVFFVFFLISYSKVKSDAAYIWTTWADGIAAGVC